ncbi:DUF885 domain-containing protein [Fulvivirga sedimenti]|uniref:DUF885 domain-containing protein n=1 Tax=Fulvivirga sedimenti TaxID=2879465 RepID=A0A9X1KZW1_9BACT|nr:DUF885 domain-containing protein [Fulvivirga sedimenti]MCA6075151.1 DUF885 domain-containing protein [Fulvivirga sedimenti]MCA6076328.1 DUF885 domain-containing protein [Fulvivirga sedimenti]MCA6077456.1 DUF885 domain-containing protein [Fulvivirga sedimenti]
MRTYSRILLLVMLTACSQPSEQKENTSPEIPIEEIFEDFYEERIRFNPFEATAAGDNRYNDTIPIFISDSYQQRLLDFYTSYAEKTRAYPEDVLSESQKLYRDVLLWECDVKKEGLENIYGVVTTPLFGLPAIDVAPINQIFSFHLYVSQLANGTGAQPFKTTEDYYDWLSRLEDYLQWLDTAKAKMKEGISAKFTLPRVIVEKMILQLDAFIDTPVKEHTFYQPVANLSNDLPPIEHEVLPAKYAEFIEKKLIPAYTDLKNFLRDEYLPQAVETAGIGALPGGSETYRYLVKYHTTTNMTPDEIFELGKSEVERISAEMEKVKTQLGFQGTLSGFFDHLRSKPELMPFSSAEEVLANFRQIHDRMQPQLNILFNQKPKSAFEIRRTEAFREASASAEYFPGSIDGSRPGIFYVPVPDATSYNIVGDESLFLHEAIPGHHYQLSLQQENQDLPKFMHTEGLGVYVEGWALYAESLGKELGLYEDPYQYFGMLSAEMHRAIRLVVDVGMHAKGWTREEAIQYSLDHEAESETSITAEIERYMVAPGQALSYKIGQLKIIELRNRAEVELGDAFDIRAFHDQVLGTGSLPLVLLEQKIDGWIDAKQVNP